jgi:glycosyltransferase involved in cell wall biosynthesis
MAENIKPFLSIITVVFNGGKTLEKTIQSIDEQSFKKIEYIIIDGASKDNTIEVIEKYEKSVHHWISESDEGLYDAMNKGLKIATGEYVWFINAGDQLYDRDTAENIFKLHTAENADIYYGEAVIINAEGNEIGLRRQKVPEKLTWKSLKMGMVVSHQSIIVRRTLAPFYNLKYKYSTDIDWVIYSLKAAGKIVNTHQIVSRFLEGGRSRQTIIPSLKERFNIMSHYYGFFTTVAYHFPIAFKFIVFLFRNKRF